MPLHHHQYPQQHQLPQLHQQRNMNLTRYHQMPSTGHLQQTIQQANNHYTNYYNGHQMVKSQSAPGLPYNINHWVIQEAELRRLHYQQMPAPLLPRAPVVSHSSQSSIDNQTNYENHVYENSPIRDPNVPGLQPIQPITQPQQIGKHPEINSQKSLFTTSPH